MTHRIPWRRGRAAGPDANRPPAGDGHGSRPGGLVFLFLADEQRSDDHAAWRRGRSVLLEVDKKIAAAPEVAYRVRALPGRGSAAQGEPRPAGQLSRRAIRRPAAGVDFARALGITRTAMRRDLAVLGLSAVPVARPAIVFFAVDPPIADAVTAEEYGQLAREASITWVVPECSAPLMSPAFAAGDARILTDHYAVTDEVAHLLQAGRKLSPLGGGGP